MAHAPTADLSEANVRLDASADRVALAAFGVGGIGLALSFVLLMAAGTDEAREHFWRAWLVNFLFVLSIALGGLFFTFVQHLTRAGWSVAVRRPAEALAANLRWLWLLFLPILGLLALDKVSGSHHFGLLFHWADLEHLASINSAMVEEAALIEGKTGFLNPTFFVIRAVVYFVVWAFLGWWFWSMSVRQDSTGDRAITERMQTFSAPAALLFGVTITFAAVDWIMSLNPAWFSTIFGVYFFAAVCTGGFGAMIVTLMALQRNGRLVGIVSSEHYQDLGKLLFAFGVVFWAYIAFSQYMLIWYANLPETTTWFAARQIGDWRWFSVALLFLHFIFPFLLLISKHPKRIRATLLVMACWMLVIHWLDLYWLVVPKIPVDIYYMTSYEMLLETNAGTSTLLASLVNWTLLVGMGGLMVGATLRSLRQRALVPLRDPRLHESLAFENM